MDLFDNIDNIIIVCAPRLTAFISQFTSCRFHIVTEMHQENTGHLLKMSEIGQFFHSLPRFSVDL